MAQKTSPKVEESLKGFLIVGEALDGVHTFNEFQFTNLLIFLLLCFSSIFSLNLAFDSGLFWYLLALSFLLAAVYFVSNYKTTITYATTKFRIIRIVEGNVISRLFFRSSRLVGFSDLHYEHVESIKVSTPPVNIPKLYLSILLISFGLLMRTNNGSLVSTTTSIEQVISLLLILAGSINALLSIPFGGVRLIVQSISGDSMEFPEKQTPPEFIDDLIFSCRTFLSYGAT
ncbi:MAG: hypothetical protein ACW98K_06940 [Candidatus Kariarchaeaceae archaeon]|jgi:hypothetical protein